jgi:hypothetical protein
MIIKELKWINKGDSEIFNHTKKILKTILYKFYTFNALKKKLRTFDKSYRIVPSLRDIRTIWFLKYEATYKYLCNHYINHRLDLLGSGWVRSSYDAAPLGLEGYKYKKNIEVKVFDPTGKWLEKILFRKHAVKSQKIWGLIDIDYSPIDWQKDYKSGYRWSNKSWFKSCLLVISKFPGVDIKVPWELARMQHLSQMAIYAHQADTEERQKLVKEFKNQVLDFIATNPCEFGVNWSCTMDVAIRAANILVAYDLFKQIDTRGINDDIEAIFASSMHEHGRFIVSHLEYASNFTGNHYLSNICGLAFIAAYLEPTIETNLWLAFALQELINEFKKQFYEDGSNFEASTSYHRLSTEMVLYTTALYLGLTNDRKKAIVDYNRQNWHVIPGLHKLDEQEFDIATPYLFPDWYLERLFKAGCFTADLLKPTNEIPQIGDNDSGRFFKFTPVGEFITNKQAEEKYFNLLGYQELGNDSEELYWDENILDHRPLLAAMAGLFDYSEFNHAATAFPLEMGMITVLLKNTIRIKKDKSYHNVVVSPSSNLDLQFSRETNFYPIDTELSIPLNQNLSFHPYPDSGIFILKSDRIHLTIMAGGVGQNGFGGHAHNDKLSIELNIDCKDLAVDPGTYLYTPLPEYRNTYRSTIAHNCIQVRGKEQIQIIHDSSNLFQLIGKPSISIKTLSKNYIEVHFRNDIFTNIRSIGIMAEKICITDYCDCPFDINFQEERQMSNGYGKTKSFRFEN